MSATGSTADKRGGSSNKAEMGQNQTILPLGIRLALPAPTRYFGVA
jgi:hypothetical protein